MGTFSYKRMMYDNTIRPSEIMNEIEIPESVFKYRKFVDLDDVSKDTFWEEGLSGTMYFSLPEAFNSNDTEDCILLYDKEKCKNKILKMGGFGIVGELNDKFDAIWKGFDTLIEQNVRNNVKIGCFTSCKPEEEYMWNCKDFGGKHTGYCIEYEVDKAYFFPNATVFLPILYEENHIDMTEVILDLIDATWNGEDISLHNILMSNGYNFCLSKLLKPYEDEREWRIVITKNNWKTYFENKEMSKKDFSKKIKAIYLGADCEKLDDYEMYKEFAMEICQKLSVPLYQMKRSYNSLDKIQLC